VNSPVIVVEYNEEWPAIYERERQLIASMLGETIIAIEHVGSTAVVGLSAKPIIDLMLVVERLEPGEVYARYLETLGYLFVADAGSSDRHFFKKGEPRSHHLHLVEEGSQEHRRLIAFRDYLRAHPETRQEYEALKKALALQFRFEREAYTKAKTEFVRSIEARTL